MSDEEILQTEKAVAAPQLNIEPKIAEYNIIAQQAAQVNDFVLNNAVYHLKEDNYNVIPFEEYFGKDVTYASNIRALKITSCIVNKDESIADRFATLLRGIDDTLAVVFRRLPKCVEMYIVVKTTGAWKNGETQNKIKRLSNYINGIFPGTQTEIISPLIHENDEDDTETSRTLKLGENCRAVSVFSGLPSEKNSDYATQGIEKVLNGIVPQSEDESYTIVLLADAIPKEITDFLLNTYKDLATQISSLVQIQYQKGSGTSNSQGTSQSYSESTGTSHTDSSSKSGNVNAGINAGINSSRSESHTAPELSKADKGWRIAQGVGEGIEALGELPIPVVKDFAKGIGKIVQAVCDTRNDIQSGRSTTTGTSKGSSLGFSLGAGVTSTHGTADTESYQETRTTENSKSSSEEKNESVSFTSTSYFLSDLLNKLEAMIERVDQNKETGLWAYASYVLAKDQTVSDNVANFLRAITLGKNSYIEPSFVQTWTQEDKDFKEIADYVKHFCHPAFQSAENNLSAWGYVTATTAELANALAFPQKSVDMLPVSECAVFDGIPNGGFDDDKVKLGKLLHMNIVDDKGFDEGDNNTSFVSLDRNSLTSHTFIAGKTGSGKSNAICHILKNTCKKDNNTHFLVIEPAKGEYKNFFGGDKTVSVYGTNKNITRLLKINPFSFPKDILVSEHLEMLIGILEACWPLYAAMPDILKKAFEKAYEDCGWNLENSTNEFEEKGYERLFPNFDDVARCTRQIIESSEYDSENKGAYKGALLTRLGSLSNGVYRDIFCSNELKAEELFEQNVIVDLSRVNSDETNALMMGILVMKLREYYISKGKASADLMHLTVLEEAHHLLKKPPVYSSESGNLLAKSVNMISNAIAEMRFYSEGFIIADQSPDMLDESVVRNTNTKILMQLPYKDDRELVGKAAGLNDNQIDELVKLHPGVAVVYQNGWNDPLLCRFTLEKAKALYVKPVEEETKEEAADPAEFMKLLLGANVKSSRDKILLMTDKLKLEGACRAAVYRILDCNDDTLIWSSHIASKLFPKAYEAVKDAYRSNSDTNTWTDSARNALDNADDLTTRDRIVQSVIYDYLVNELKNVKAMDRWLKEVKG